MNLPEAEKAVKTYLKQNYSTCGVLINATEEFSKCFAFFYQSYKYIESRDINDMVVGHGPLIVSKETGEIFETGSAYSLEQYVASFNNTGDPMKSIPGWDELGPKWNIEIVSFTSRDNSFGAIKSLKKALAKDLKEAKEILDSFYSGKVVQLSLKNREDAEELVNSLKEFGFGTELKMITDLQL